MLKITGTRWILPCWIVIGIVAGSAWAQSAGRCVIKSMVGDVKIQRSKSPKWIKARPNMPLRANDAVRTFVESEAVVKMADGSTISLKENTTLELSTLLKTAGGASKTGVKILTGDLMANVKKLVHKGSKFEFETPTAVAAIRGTQVGFDVDQDKTDIKVYEGSVYVRPKGSKKETEVKANEMTSVEKGQKKIVVQTMEGKDKEEAAAAVDTTKEEVDTTKEEVDTTAEADTTAAVDTVETVRLVLRVLSPENGLVVEPGGQVVVSGKVAPPMAAVRVGGSDVRPKPTGEFRTIVTGPKEEGQYTVEIEVSYGDQSKTATRMYMVKSAPVDLKLVVNEPKNGQVVDKPLIRISGYVTPGAELSVSGMSINVPANGNFTKDVPIPDEEGDVVLEIEAVLQQESKTETRTVVYKVPEEDIVITVQMPADRQVVCDRKLQVKGIVKPASVTEISVNGMDIPVRNGMFSDYILLPDEMGEIEVDFEVTRESDSRSVRRVVRYDPAGEKCNTDIPSIQPTSLPVNSRTNKIMFTVYDKTPSDEITFYTSADGSRDSETGAPGSRFYLNLEEGIHTYEIYAEDKVGNKSQRITGVVSFLMKDPIIRLSDPSGPYKLLHIPPSTPARDFRPEYTIEFSVENLPDDNPKLLKEIRVINKTTGDTKSLKNFTTDTDFDFDIRLKRGKNQIVIEVRDVNDRILTRDLTIEIK